MRAAYRLVLLSSVVSLAACGGEKPYPNRPILLVCPWAAGGGTDRVSRQVAAFLEAELGVPVNVINATGGAGVTGHSRGARARPDGYTLAMMTVEINMLRWRKLTKLSWEDFEPLMLLNRDAAALFVRADSPWKDLADLTEAVRERPGELTASGTATGGIWHLALAGWLGAADMRPGDVIWVPSRGAGPSLQDLASGGLDMVCCSLPEGRTLLKSGVLRCLGIMADDPLDGYEGVPTFKSLGVDWSMGAWRGLALPKGVPDEVEEALIPALKRIVTGESTVEVERIVSGERVVEKITFPEFMRREAYHPTWELPDRFRATLAKTDAELGWLLTSDEFASISEDLIRPLYFPSLLFALGGLFLLLLALGRFLDAERKKSLAPAPSVEGALDFALVIAAVLAHILLAERLGFVIASAGILLVLFLRLGTRLWVSLATTALVVPVVYQLFANFLRVPLPRGYFGW